MNSNSELTFILTILQHQSSAHALEFHPAIDWALFYKLVRRHRVWHQVHNVFKHNRFECPITTKLAQFCEFDKKRILMTAGETTRIARAFTTEGIEHCFVKGVVLNAHLYGGMYTRPCKDIDVWVNANTYPVAVAALLTLGYKKKLPGYALTGFKERWYMRNKHDMAFYHPEKKIEVELHFRLSYFGLDFFPLTAIPLAPINLLNIPVLAPQDDYHLLYLMIHGAIHAWIRLRWLQDIALFIKNKPCDLKHVYNLAKQINCQHIVEQSLILVSNMFKLDNHELTEIIQTSSLHAASLALKAQAFIDADYEMTDGLRNINMFFKYRLYLAKLAVRGQKFHAIFGDLFKIDQLFIYVTFPDKLSFLYYAIYPLWVLKYALSSLLPSRDSYT